MGCLNESSWGISDCRQETNKHIASVARNDASYEQISITVPLLYSPSSADHSCFLCCCFFNSWISLKCCALGFRAPVYHKTNKSDTLHLFAERLVS